MNPPPWQTHQNQHGPRPNMKPLPNMTVNIFLPAPGNRGRGRPTKQHPSMHKPLSAGSGAFMQDPRASGSPTSSFTSPRYKDSAEVDDSPMDNDFSAKHAK